MNRRHEDGYSLVELLGSIAIMSVALVAAYDVIDLALRVTSDVGSTATDPMALSAELHLRRDLQKAIALPEQGTTSRGPLVLKLGSDVEVKWNRKGNRLIRSEKTGIDDQPFTETLALRQVVGWKWSALSPSLLEVSFDIDQSSLPAGLSVSGPPTNERMRVRKVIHVSPRCIAGVRPW
jgi:type II secretory pathway component PulJ